MDDQEDPKAEASAEKAYAAAAEAVPVTPETEPEPKPEAAAEPAPAEPEAEAPPVEFPAKAERATKPAAKPASAVEPAAQPDLAQPDLAKAELRKARKPAKPSPRPVAVAKVKPVAVAKAKPVAAKTAQKPTPKGAIAKAPTKAVVVKSGPVKSSSSAVKPSPAPQLKEKTMENAPEFSEGLQKVAADAQAKAKTAYDKGTALFGEYAEFAKGNVEALVESGKILATGVQKIGSDWVAEGKTALETASSDVKQLTAVKSPSEFIKLHTDILRRNFDSAVALTSKNGEAFVKLATDSFAPISGRISLAAEKLKQAA